MWTECTEVSFQWKCLGFLPSQQKHKNEVSVSDACTDMSLIQDQDAVTSRFRVLQALLELPIYV